MDKDGPDVFLFLGWVVGDNLGVVFSGWSLFAVGLCGLSSWCSAQAWLAQSTAQLRREDAKFGKKHISSLGEMGLSVLSRFPFWRFKGNRPHFGGLHLLGTPSSEAISGTLAIQAHVSADRWLDI